MISEQRSPMTPLLPTVQWNNSLQKTDRLTKDFKSYFMQQLLLCIKCMKHNFLICRCCPLPSTSLTRRSTCSCRPGSPWTRSDSTLRGSGTMMCPPSLLWTRELTREMGSLKYLVIFCELSYLLNKQSD